jgi:hypothetical protein
MHCPGGIQRQQLRPARGRWIDLVHARIPPAAAAAAPKWLREVQQHLAEAAADHGPIRELHSSFWRQHAIELEGDFLTRFTAGPPGASWPT